MLFSRLARAFSTSSSLPLCWGCKKRDPDGNEDRLEEKGGGDQRLYLLDRDLSRRAYPLKVFKC